MKAASSSFYRAPEYEIYRHIDFILRQDEEKGVKVFIKRVGERIDEAQCEKILNFLEQYPTARLAYLEHIVIHMHSEVILFRFFSRQYLSLCS